jgi:protein-tyrosine phosphatase
VKLPPPFVDIHCHLLPGLDDGPATLDESLAMAEMTVADGIATVVATPHYSDAATQNSAAVIRTAVARFQRLLDDRRVPLRVLPGADVRIQPELAHKIRRGDVLTLADRGRHVLLELPHEVYIPLDRLLADLRGAELVGILSHPERNRGLQRQPDLLPPLVRQGALLQVTAESITGGFGARAQRCSEWLIRQGLVHFVATDAHGIASRPPLLRQAFHRVTQLAGEEAAVKCFCLNPARLASGAEIGPASAGRPSSWTSRVRHSPLFAAIATH